MGPQLPVCDNLHAMKYRSPGENFREAMNRVAGGLKDDDRHFRAFREILMEMRFMPAGRVQNAIGSLRATTPYNCYVSGTIADSLVDGEGNIMDRFAEAMKTMRMGGGIGYDFSTLRPRRDVIRSLQSSSSGPVGDRNNPGFMYVFDTGCKTIASSGHRRGAQMGVLRVDHPDIEEFIHAKQNTDQLTAFNISVGITDEFMEALAAKRPFALKFEGRKYREVDAEDLWEQLMRSTWDWAEPGVLFIDTINRMNNLWYCETIAATNPCGEQPLPPYGACLLGSFNLPKYLIGTMGGDYKFDVEQFRADIHEVVRAMDNVVDAALYPLPQQEAEAKSKRRMGLGVTGLANCIEGILGRPSYGDRDFIGMQMMILNILRDESYRASVQLAREKGAFPLFDADRYCEGGFVKTLPADVQRDIRKYGIRNSHLTSIAPTGTISFCADNVSSGIEPVFEPVTQRPFNTPDGPVVVSVPDYGHARGIRGRNTNDVTIQQHVDVLIAAATRVDSAVSKTCNVGGDTPWEQFKGIYVDAYAGGAKGATTFNKDGKRMALLTAGTKQEDEPQEIVSEGASCQIDPATGRRSCE